MDEIKILADISLSYFMYASSSSQYVAVYVVASRVSWRHEIAMNVITQNKITFYVFLNKILVNI